MSYLLVLERNVIHFLRSLFSFVPSLPLRLSEISYSFLFSRKSKQSKAIPTPLRSRMNAMNALENTKEKKDILSKHLTQAIQTIDNSSSAHFPSDIQALQTR